MSFRCVKKVEKKKLEIKRQNIVQKVKIIINNTKDRTILRTHNVIYVTTHINVRIHTRIERIQPKQMISNPVQYKNICE